MAETDKVPLILVTGGARSGKSRFAEQYVERIAEATGRPVAYIATAEALDGEMKERIALHRERRPETWQTYEEPSHVDGLLARLPREAIVLVDCLALLVSNWIVHDELDTSTLTVKMDALCQALCARMSTTVVVTNEVGLGIVPGNALSRQYRDSLGLLNGRVAALSRQVILTVAGIPIDLRKLEVPLP